MMKENDKSNLAPLTFWQIVGSTFAAALGVQSEENRKRDFTRGNIVAFIFSGVLFTVCFVIAIITIVNVVLS